MLIILNTTFGISVYKENPSDTLSKPKILDIPSYQNSKSYFYEPYPQEVGSSLFQLGGSVSLLPLPLVENEYPIPAVDLQCKIGVFKNISLLGTISTNYFTNLIHAGLQYNTNFGNFSFGIASNIGTFIGFISTEGQFDNNSAFAVFLMPIFRTGYRFEEFSVSMAWEITYIFEAVSIVSDLRDVAIVNKVNDIFCTIAVEQPFLKNQLISIGFSLTYSRTPYSSWLMFNTIDQYLFIPEFFFSFQL